MRSSKINSFDLHKHTLNTLGQFLDIAVGGSLKTSLKLHTNTTVQTCPISYNTISTKISSKTVSCIDGWTLNAGNTLYEGSDDVNLMV